MSGAKTILLLLGLCLIGGVALAEPPPAPFVMIVNASNPMESASRKFLGEAFLKKITRWESGEAIRPVDQHADSNVRRAFSEAVLDRSVTAVRNYWQQAIFSGRDVPPPELPGDAEVLAYVRKHTGAVGYISGNASTSGAKVLLLR